eukprot:CAMPEP_0177749280 /NCGR_PEP_ID=MMETSP0484_2-20121128/32400_1 /TAXON_ID=354590 /ORGANISM="Rhodomonas lens, Strain RHODO" /LENGTH=69 /DNA_ID=CAMNT_0019264249 /DNA_START=42 /DNA_END=248 /DNA_ORIENTATION=-
MPPPDLRHEALPLLRAHIPASPSEIDARDRPFPLQHVRGFWHNRHVRPLSPLNLFHVREQRPYEPHHFL